MLVLTRKRAEEIVIGQAVIVRILEIHGDRVRVGITAPPEVAVHRQEVARAIAQRENARPSREYVQLLGRGPPVAT